MSANLRKMSITILTFIFDKLSENVKNVISFKENIFNLKKTCFFLRKSGRMSNCVGILHSANTHVYSSIL